MQARVRRAARGTPLDITAPTTARLADAYRELLHRLPDADPDISGPALAAAHAAVLEVATLCEGRAPTLAEESYVVRRADAIAELAASLAGGADSADAHSNDPPASVVEARDELDQLTGTSSVDRLLELADRPAHRNDDR
jgi:hypothetical protein